MKLFSIIVLISFIVTPVVSQGKSDKGSARLMFYNVENLFDTFDDPLTDDNEFLPSGVRRWNRSRYEKKINSLYKVITAAGEWDSPAVIGLCEIENRKVLEDLVYGTYLSKTGYGIIHEDSPDSRGIDVAMIFRKDQVAIMVHRTMDLSINSASPFPTRSVLYVKCLIAGDTLHLFINHWPSRRGGVLAGEQVRSEIASMVRCAADSINRDGRAKIIIMGDFNCTPDDPVIRIITEDKGSGITVPGSRFENLTDNKGRFNGTYRYQGIWEQLDQMIVSEWLLSTPAGLVTDKGKFRIFGADFLLENDETWPGSNTFPTYRGYRYRGGFSDHLPVLLDLSVR